MNRALVDRIAEAVLYEGYILYPYRPALKNRQRWTFGGVYPQAYSQRHGGSDACFLQTECLVQGSEATRLNIRVRFLHLVQRLVAKRDEPVPERNAEAALQGYSCPQTSFRLVQSLDI